MTWQVRDRRLEFDKTLLMGVLNLTSDSFSDGGKFLDPEKATQQGLKLVREGADLLDLGAESTRPGARPVSSDEELGRLLPVLRALRSQVIVPISIDTTKPEVAEACLEEGAHIINDVSGLKDSGAAMAETVRRFEAGIILMHRRGTPQTMQQFADYQDVTKEVIRELQASIEMALDHGVKPEQIVVDPGLGFAKTAGQNVEILNEIEKFHALGFPLLLGPSRKSFIGELTGREVAEREFGTAAVVTYAVLKRVQMIRVHEVGAMRDAVCVAEVLRGDRYVGSFKMGLD